MIIVTFEVIFYFKGIEGIMAVSCDRFGTEFVANCRIGACHIPKPTMNIIAKISTATIALGSLTLDVSGESSMYIFLIIHA